MRNYSHSGGFYRQGQKFESREFGEEEKLRLNKTRGSGHRAPQPSITARKSHRNWRETFG